MMMTRRSFVAQNTIQFYSTFAKGNVAPTECIQEREVIASIIDSYAHPANWTWIIACDETAWQRVLMVCRRRKLMRIASRMFASLALVLSLPSTQAAAQQPNNKPSACDGKYNIVRVSEIKPRIMA